MEDYSEYSSEEQEERLTALNTPTVIQPPPFQGDKRESPARSTTPYKPSPPFSPLNEDGLAPWSPPKPTPSDRPPGKLSSSDFSSLDRIPKSSVPPNQLANSPKSPVFMRLAEDTNRRTERLHRVQEFKSKQEEMTVPTSRKASPEHTEAVYRRLSQDAIDRKIAATQMLTRRNEETFRKSPELRIPKSQEKALIGRLEEDAKRRMELKRKHEREKEAVEAAVAFELANSRHPPRPRDPKVLNRLQQPSPKPQPEPSPPPARVFSKHQSELSGTRLMHAKRPSAPSMETPVETRLSPRQVEELVGRLYASRSRVGVSLTMPNTAKAKQKSKLMETKTNSTVERLWLDGELQSTLSKESTQGKGLEDLDDLLLRLKAKAVPEPKKAKVPSHHPTLSSPAKAKDRRYEGDVPKEVQSPFRGSDRRGGYHQANLSLPSSPTPKTQHRMRSKPIPPRPEMSPLSLPKSEISPRSRPVTSQPSPTPLQSYRFLASSD